MRLVLILFSLSLLVWPHFADACEGGTKERRMRLEKSFNKADQNADRAISLNEISGFDFSTGKTYRPDIDLKMYFEQVDLNHDGRLTIEEWEKEIRLPQYLPQC